MTFWMIDIRLNQLMTGNGNKQLHWLAKTHSKTITTLSIHGFRVSDLDGNLKVELDL